MLNLVFVIDDEDGEKLAEPLLQLIVEQHFITIPSASEPICATPHKLLLLNGTQLYKLESLPDSQCVIVFKKI